MIILGKAPVGIYGPYRTTGRLIRKRRVASTLGLWQVAQTLGCKVSELSGWERGKPIPTDMFQPLVDAIPSLRREELEQAIEEAQNR